MGEKLEIMREWMEENGNGIKTMIGGDFNARTGELGGEVREEGDVEGGGRVSMDKKVNGDGRLLVSKLEEVGWEIMNGGVAGDEKGNWTYTGGRGQTVIDYVIGSGEVRESIGKLEIEERVESDHQPLSVWVKGEGIRRTKGIGVGKGRWDWSMEGREEFREEMGKVQGSGETVEREWVNMREKIKGILGKGNRVGVGEKGKGGRWFDEKCREEKRRVRRELKRWRREGGDGETYIERKREYGKLCLRKKGEENERWEKLAQEARTEGQVWEIVRRERRKGEGGSGEGIEMREWNDYFKELLGGVEGKVTLGAYGEMRGDGEEALGKEEVRRAIDKMRDKKAVGIDGIPAEVWKYGGG
ncbi:hypothetical protein RF55_15674 [Lasius niger]|uniref:Uncharacterized protein n=1 Tax=Lasius niger TaxID=67767 RepID=A0A0J7K629_LASNI|nr:hypothetical protein RF55_15674 [Lasius niger]